MKTIRNVKMVADSKRRKGRKEAVSVAFSCSVSENKNKYANNNAMPTQKKWMVKGTNCK